MTDLNKLFCPTSMSLDGSIHIAELMVSEGQEVSKNQTLVILESGNYTMEYPADQDCIIEKIHCFKGQKVEKNDLLFETRPK